MTKNENRKIMPTPSQYLIGKNVKLRFIKLVPENKDKGYVPYYHFVIENDTNDNVGHINLRIGDTNHINYCAGHIGYEVLPAFRGNYISYYSCLALEPFVKLFYDSVLITVNPSNIPSIRIIEKLGCKFIDTVDIQPNEEAYLKGERVKSRYRWELKNV